MEVDFTEEDPTDGWTAYSGDVTHADTDSIMMVSGPVGVTAARGGDQYERRVPAGGTSMPLAFLEYVPSGGDANPIGFATTTFDTPGTGGSLPTAVADSGAVFETIAATLNFDLAAGSPVHDRRPAQDDPDRYTRAFFGLYLYDLYEDAGGTDIDYAVQIGITTSWTIGATSDDLTMSYVPAAITGEAIPSVIVTDNNGYWFTTTYPDWPVSDGATFEMRDVPTMAGIDDPTLPVTMEDVITVAYPEWAGVVGVTIYFSAGFGAFNMEPLWSVLIPPEGATFRFADLPLHSSLDPGDILPSAGTKRISVGAIEVDGDPFEGYQGWVVEDWWDERFIGRSLDGRFEFTAP
jgi:hypothetical protein